MLRSNSSRTSSRWFLGLARAIVSTPLLLISACQTYSPATINQAGGLSIRVSATGEAQPVAFVKSPRDTVTIQRVLRIHGRVVVSEDDLMRLRVDSVISGLPNRPGEVKEAGIAGSLALIPVVNGNLVGFSMAREQLSTGGKVAIMIGVLLVTGVLVMAMVASSIKIDLCGGQSSAWCHK